VCFWHSHYFDRPNLAICNSSSIILYEEIPAGAYHITNQKFPWPSPDPDLIRLDLKNFSRLKECVVPAMLFFRTNNADPSRDGLYAIFPRLYKNLKQVLFFQFMIFVFANKDGYVGS
jgi:hypothetical protein